ncbi:MAG: hypothetical protein ACKOQ0_07160 [Solirubrobacterales bacterium]
MAPESPPFRRRLTTWLVTGPVGHGAAAAADIATFAASQARARLRRAREGE